MVIEVLFFGFDEAYSPSDEGDIQEEDDSHSDISIQERICVIGIGIGVVDDEENDDDGDEIVDYDEELKNIPKK